MKIIMQAALVGFMSSVCLTATSQDASSVDRLEKETVHLLARAEGVTDPGVFKTLAGRISTGQLVAAFYCDSPIARLIALEAAAYVEMPTPLLPYLTVLMRTSEHRTASRAAAALIANLERLSERVEGAVELISGQAAQLMDMLIETASDDRLILDQRAVSLQALSLLSKMSSSNHSAINQFLIDPERVIRAAAFQNLQIPLDDKTLSLLVTMATDDTDEGLRCQAASLLCENALSHNVVAPSADLKKVMMKTLETSTGLEGAASLLGCLVGFEPAARSELVEAVLKHPNSAIKKYWDTLTQTSR